MNDLAIMAHVNEQLPLIKEILKRFGLDIQVTHINQRYCGEKWKSFFGVYQGKHYQFDWFASICAYPTWVNGNESIRRNLRYGFQQESWGNMIYVGGVPGQEHFEYPLG
jgi:hypothetical protein